ncbi:MAG: ribonuclease III [Cyanobacteria bacterium REEB459]|nr:ribonuclease III [Cyanobacteria bacterium REEB459]
MLSLPVFQNPDLLLQALTHSSYARQHPGTADYERLEFLGDSIIELVVRDLLYARHPNAPEGELSQRSDRLVNQACLADLAVQLGLPDRLRLGVGAQRERQNPSLQADVFEAVIGAYRLDAGLESTYTYLVALFTPLLEESWDVVSLDPVSQLQEYLQSRPGLPMPSYQVLGETGPDHAPCFTVAVLIDGQVYGVGRGGSKRIARKRAALATLKQMDTCPLN